MSLTFNIADFGLLSFPVNGRILTYCVIAFVTSYRFKLNSQRYYLTTTSIGSVHVDVEKLRLIRKLWCKKREFPLAE